jgi:hypothetical protein
MSRCELAIRLDAPDGVYAAGSEVSGAVLVDVDAEVECRRLDVTLEWRTHGRGNTYRQVVATRSELPRRWLPGTRHEVPFRFALPDAPATYHGRYLNIDHYVTARADVPWAIDPKAEVEVLVVPGPGSRDAYLERAAGGPKDPSDAARRRSKALFWLTLPLLPVVAVLMLMLLVVLLPILSTVAAVRLLRRRLTEQRLGRVELEVGAASLAAPDEPTRMGAAMARVGELASSVVHPREPARYVAGEGDVVNVRIVFTPREHVDLDGVYVDVGATEQVVSGSGTKRTSHVHVIHQASVLVAPPRRFPAGAQVELMGTITIPPTSAFTLKAPDNEIAWSVGARIRIPRFPDWAARHTLVVVPAE